MVELDPAVTRFARTYFELPSNVTVHDEDALSFVSRARAEGARYDYVVHDVFTGGAEPGALFTDDFLQSLRRLMKLSGSIAIVSISRLTTRGMYTDNLRRTMPQIWNAKTPGGRFRG